MMRRSRASMRWCLEGREGEGEEGSNLASHTEAVSQLRTALVTLSEHQLRSLTSSSLRHS